MKQEESYLVDSKPVRLVKMDAQFTAKITPNSKFRQALDTKSTKTIVVHPIIKGIDLLQQDEQLDTLLKNADCEWAFPAYRDLESDTLLYLTDEIVISLVKGTEITDVLADLPAEAVVLDRLTESDNYVLKLQNPKKTNPFTFCSQLLKVQGIKWAEPNAHRSFKSEALPNDASVNNQWAVRNWGNFYGVSDADLDLGESSGSDAWRGSTQPWGSEGIRIAIIDEGIESSHADLAANMLTGWDFQNNSANTDPILSTENHGTEVAGVAAAVANNSVGIAGAAGACKILPVKVYDGTSSASASQIYNALTYAAANADVFSVTWTTSSSSTITDGFYYLQTRSRRDRGSSVLCSSGNSASGYALGQINLPNAGTYKIKFSYVKDASVVAGNDCIWLANFILPSGTIRTFNSPTLPTGWTMSTSPNNWSGSVDPVHSYGSSAYAWRSATGLANGQESYVESESFTIAGAGTVYFSVWQSSDASDYFRTTVTQTFPSASPVITTYSGANPAVSPAVGYPASVSGNTAVGASSSFDYRSDYSQYGSSLAFLSPGGDNYALILTTDRSGAAGDNSADSYVFTSGTSFSAPAAAGVAALAFSRNGNLTRVQLRDVLNQNCEKVGSTTYTGTPNSRNDYYGYGRLNASLVIDNVTADTTTPTYTSALAANIRGVDVTFSEPMGKNVSVASKYTISGTGKGSLASNPSKVVRMTPTVYRLNWASGEMTAGTANLTVAVASDVQDSAGNAVSGTLSRTIDATKRVVAINCSTSYEYYSPFESEWFVGNEAQTAKYATVGSLNYLPVTIVFAYGAPNTAPQEIYWGQRYRYATNTYNIDSFTVQGLTASTSYKMRLHFCDLVDTTTGASKFDIYLNSTLYATDVDVIAQSGGRYYALQLDYTGVTSDGSGRIQVETRPKSVSSIYRSQMLNAIEVFKP